MANIQAKAWTYTTTKGGLIPNLHLTNYDIPDHVDDNHILIEVLNASLNPGDYKTPDTPILKWFIKKPASLCYDFCGRILTLPKNLSQNKENDSPHNHLKPNQIVFGMHRDLKTLGTLKTLMWIHKDNVYPLPSTIPTEHGSALGVAAITAYQAIHSHSYQYANKNNNKTNNNNKNKNPTQTKVLINGGTGGVGTFAIQIAKSLNMHVTTTCSTSGIELCKSLGADETLDYKSPTFLTDLCCDINNPKKFDLVIDNVGNNPDFHRLSEKFLNPDNGHFILVGLMAENWSGVISMLDSWLRPVWLGGVARKWKAIFTMNNVADYAALAKLAEEGKLKVVVDEVFGFKDVTKAFERVMTGRVKGKVIVDIRS